MARVGSRGISGPVRPVASAGAVAVLLLLVGAPVGLSGGSLTASSPGVQPPGLSNAAMAFDPLDNYTVLFGGIEGSPGSNSNATWTFAAGRWTQLHPAVSPPATNGALFTYDASDGYLLLYEALVVTSGGGGATWSFVHGVWTNRTATTGPSPPIFGECSMAYDPTDGYAVLLGIDYLHPTLNQTWEYSAGTWHNATTSPSPGGRSQWLLQWDPGTGSLLHLGGGPPPGTGATGSPLCADFWAFSRGAWSPRPEEGPCEAAPGSMMAYDAADGELVEYSGALNGSCFGAPCDWTWSFNGTAWNGAAVSPAPPLAQYSFPASAYDGGDQEVLLFGGLLASGAGAVRSAQTWTFSGGAWHNETPAATSSGGTAPGTLPLAEELGIVAGVLALSGGAVLLYRDSTRRRGRPPSEPA